MEKIKNFLNENFNFEYLTGILLYFFMPVVTIFILLLINETGLIMLNVMPYFATMVMLLVVFREQIWNQIKEKTSLESVKYIVFGFMGLLVANLILTYLAQLIILWMQNPAIWGNEETLMSISEIVGNFNMGIITISAAISEELVFRFCVYKFIKNRKIAFIVGTLFFALIHLESFGAIELVSLFVVYLPLSLILNGIYYKTDNIFVNICIHCLNNVAGILI